MKRLMMMPGALAALLVAFALLAPGALEARDDIEYGRYLGVRLRMYEEANKVFDRIIESGTKDEILRARQTKAEVIKDQADYEYPDDESARMDMYEQAVEVFGDPEEHDGVLAKSIMQLDLAESLRRSDPAGARSYCNDAAEVLTQHRDELVTLRDNDMDAFAPFAETFNSIWYQLCRSFYVKALTYEMNSEQRNTLLEQSLNEMAEFDFLREGTTRDFVLTFELRGDIELARNDAAAAVSEYLGLASFVSGFDANTTVGRLALENGYLPAAELMTTELDFEPENLERVIELYSEAYLRYGSFSNLGYLFKQFQLYRISALIKLGDSDRIEGAIELLFSLAADDDRTFRRRALVVLADIAVRESLDIELRWKCADTVYADLDTNPPSVILKNIYAYQALLKECRTARMFETYAPACYHRIGEMYYGMWRFLDAALVYRDACYRTLYFREEFGEDEEVPAHMRGRSDIIAEPGDAYKFPGEMASLFARNAGFLISPTIGEPDNSYFRELSQQADKLKASLAGLQAQLELRYKSALSLYNEEEYARAAVKYANLPASYRSFHMALYISAKSYYNVSVDPRARRVNTRGEDDEVESEGWFQRQLERHAEDLGELPESMWKGVAEPHWNVIMDRDTPAQLANWHKSVYFYKKYFLTEALRHWDDISEILADVENPNMIDGMGAVAQVINNKWLIDNPAGDGEPDRDMRRMGMAAYDLAYMLRTPPRSLPDSQRNELLAAERDIALGILRPYWKWFGNHLEGSEAYKSGALKLAFGALAEAGEVDGAEEAYRLYVESLEGKELTSAEQESVRRMARALYSVMIEVLRPRANTLTMLRSRLVSRANLLRKNAFERINPSQFPEDAAALEEAEGRLERQKVLAAHFWDVWMMENIFTSDKQADIEAYADDVLPSIRDRWEKLAESYPARWADAVRKELDRRLEKDRFSVIRKDIEEALKGEPDSAIVDLLGDLRAKEDDDDKVQRYVELLTYIRLETDPLQYFTGTLFIYEWSGFLQDKADELNERARPLVTRILKYYQEYRVRSGESGAEGVTQQSLLNLGRQYFRIRNWRNTVTYLEAFMERRLAGPVSPWGSVENIPVNQRTKTVGKTESGEELEVRYQLGKAHLELYKENGELEHLKEAALHMRRCWCFNLVRDANEVSRADYELLFQRQIEDYYLAIGRSMAEIFILMHDAEEEVEIDWPEYQNQYTRDLTQHEGDPIQSVPDSKPAAMWEATRIHLRIWTSFRQLDNYPYRDEFRYHFEHWLIHIIDWLEEYGMDDKDVDELTGDGLATIIDGAINNARNEGDLESTYLPEDMKEYLERLVEHAKRIEELSQD